MYLLMMTMMAKTSVDDDNDNDAFGSWGLNYEANGSLRSSGRSTSNSTEMDTRGHVDMYSIRVCLSDCVYSNFLHLANNCICFCKYEQIRVRQGFTVITNELIKILAPLTVYPIRLDLKCVWAHAENITLQCKNYLWE